MWTCPEGRSVMNDSRFICGACRTLVRPGAMVSVPLFLVFLVGFFAGTEPIPAATAVVAFISLLYAAVEYYRLTGSLRRPTGKGTEIWRKPRGRRDAG